VSGLWLAEFVPITVATPRLKWENRRTDSDASFLNHLPWPTHGCSLAEAFTRVFDRAPGAGCSDDFDAFQKLFVEQKLVAEGCSSLTSNIEIIASHFCTHMTSWEWAYSTVSASNRKYTNVRVYPAVKAPNRLAVISGQTLKKTFEEFVLGDPEVRTLAAKAVEVDPSYARVFHDGVCYPIGVREWRLDCDQLIVGNVHHDVEKRWFDFETPDPPPVNDAADALKDRFTTLFDELRSAQLMAFGVPIGGGTAEAILPSIWSHPDFAFDVSEGDVLITDENPPYPSILHKKKWLAIYLQPPGTALGERLSSAQERARIKSVASASAECQRWLESFMHESPNERRFRKEHWWQEAQKRWGQKLSHNAFKEAWRRAVESQQAYAWSTAGAPRKAS
jgi:hypothetical protein